MLKSSVRWSRQERTKSALVTNRLDIWKYSNPLWGSLACRTDLALVKHRLLKYLLSLTLFNFNFRLKYKTVYVPKSSVRWSRQERTKSALVTNRLDLWKYSNPLWGSLACRTDLALVKHRLLKYLLSLTLFNFNFRLKYKTVYVPKSSVRWSRQERTKSALVTNRLDLWKYSNPLWGSLACRTDLALVKHRLLKYLLSLTLFNSTLA